MCHRHIDWLLDTSHMLGTEPEGPPQYHYQLLSLCSDTARPRARPQWSESEGESPVFFRPGPSKL